MDELEEFGFQLVGLGLEVPDTLGSRTQSADSHAVLAGRRGAMAEAGTARDVLWSAEATQFGTEVIPARISTGSAFAVPAASGLDDLLGSQGLTRRADGLEHVRLTASMDRQALGAADLDDPFTSVLKEGGEHGAVAADSS
ncbi:hypothetical protein PV963_16325 [Streptomyces coeruleorubidus]|uniref:hypothetical protein n=1 Tax=Streptomyces coeruleorubidus TaxID=116188 RepID=UPI00237F8643|nr:hypothetical protein [Streptomyces coeruleorubidus]WDV51829.1 hypothetical protein PV963_16325 [Streptomyces coeruleorubidus]